MTFYIWPDFTPYDLPPLPPLPSTCITSCRSHWRRTSPLTIAVSSYRIPGLSLFPPVTVSALLLTGWNAVVYVMVMMMSAGGGARRRRCCHCGSLCVPNALLLLLVVLFSVVTVQVALFHFYGASTSDGNRILAAHPFMLHGPAVMARGSVSLHT